MNQTLAPILVAALLSAAAQAQQPLVEPMPPPVMKSSTDAGGETEEEFDHLVTPLVQRRPQMFELSSDTQVLHTSNLLLLPDIAFLKSLEDTVVVQSFDVAFTPPAWQGLTATVFARHQLIRYMDFGQFDFNAQAAGLRLGYPVQDWFTLYGGWSASRMYSDRGLDQFFRMYDTQFGLYRTQPLCSRAVAIFGYQLDWRDADPSALARVDNAFYAGLSMLLCRHVSADVLYRISTQDYTENRRSDLNHLVTGTLTYAFNDHVRLRGFADYGNNDSNILGRDYDVYDVGCGLNLSIRF